MMMVSARMPGMTYHHPVKEAVRAEPNQLLPEQSHMAYKEARTRTWLGWGWGWSSEVEPSGRTLKEVPAPLSLMVIVREGIGKSMTCLPGHLTIDLTGSKRTESARRRARGIGCRKTPCTILHTILEILELFSLSVC
jgi:hypothetical protein